MSRRIVVPLVAGMVAFAILIGLGTWQLQRLAWKEGLIAQIEARVSALPVALPPRSDWASLDLDAWEYRPIEVSGRFRNDLEVRVYALLGDDARGPQRGPGYWVLTPFELADGEGTLIVNRGFVPMEKAAPKSRAEGQIEGAAKVIGLLRRPEGRNPFTPDDDAAKRLFYARDPAPVAAALGLTDAAPFTLDALESAPGGLPQGGETKLAFPNRHLEYALTWYGLAGALAAVLAAFLLGRFRAR